MRYEPAIKQDFEDPEVKALAEAAWKELLQISRSFGEHDFTKFTKLYAQPSQLLEGLTVFADGTTWDPGSGAGVYTYYSGAWHKLG